MEPQENKQLALRKSISAHEVAEASLADLMKDGENPTYAAMLERVKQNLSELQIQAATSDPADTV